MSARLVKRIGYYTPLHRLLFHRYDYMFTPGQLAFLCRCVEETDCLKGPVVEIGCAAGATTVFLNKLLTELGSPRRYICIDNFAGFSADDIQEERNRGKESPYELLFRAYSRRYLLRALKNNDVTRPEVFQADINDFDLSVFSDVSFCLIDVDLYRPVSSALAKVVPRMAPGGIIVVDDCRPNHDYDGAWEAYMNMVADLGLSPDIRWGKLGIIDTRSVTSPSANQADARQRP